MHSDYLMARGSAAFPSLIGSLTPMRATGREFAFISSGPHSPTAGRSLPHTDSGMSPPRQRTLRWKPLPRLHCVESVSENWKVTYVQSGSFATQWYGS